MREEEMDGLDYGHPIRSGGEWETELRYSGRNHGNSFDLVVNFARERGLVRLTGGTFLVAGDFFSAGENTSSVVARMGEPTERMGNYELGVVRYRWGAKWLEFASWKGRVVSWGMHSA